MNEYEKECVEAALEVAYELLSTNNTYSYEDGKHMVVVDNGLILRVVQELNASLKPPASKQ